MADHFRPADDGTSDTSALLGSVTDLMTGLRALFGQIGKEERDLIGRFDEVEKLVDGALESIAAGYADATALQRKLHQVTSQIGEIRGAVEKSYTILDVASEGQGSAAAPAAEGSRAATIPDGEQMAQLRRAVDGMDVTLRRCLLCIAAFPEGAVIKRRLLLHWWIGEGSVPSVTEGKKRFQQLVDLRFVRAIDRPHCKKIHSCTVHPWTRRVLLAVAKTSVFLEFDSDGGSNNDFERTWRACLRDGEMLPGSGFHPKVSAIYNIDQKCVRLSTEWFIKKKCLGTVQLGLWHASKKAADAKTFHVELFNEDRLKDIGSWKNLKYLSLRGISRISAIPDSFGNLSELIVLDLRACHNLQLLTKEIRKLNKLQYLDISECYLLVEMPKGLGKMSSLEVLKGFVVASSTRKNSCRLPELVSLKNNLRKLSISIGKKVKIGKGEFKALAKLDILKSFRITWGAMPFEDDRPIAEDMKFSLPPDLEKLDLQCYPLKGISDYFTHEGLSVVKNLDKLYVTGGMLQSLEPLDQGSKCNLIRLRFLNDLPERELNKLQHIYTQSDEEVCDGRQKGILLRRENEIDNSASVP